MLFNGRYRIIIIILMIIGLTLIITISKAVRQDMEKQTTITNETGFINAGIKNTEKDTVVTVSSDDISSDGKWVANNKITVVY